MTKEQIMPVLRPLVQAGVGAVVAVLAVRLPGFALDSATQTALIIALTAVLSGAIARGQQALERRYPALGSALLTPVYSAGLAKVRAASALLEHEATVTAPATTEVPTVAPAVSADAPPAPPAA